MAASQEFADYVTGQMMGLGHVSARRMFGGFGLYHQGLVFALIVDDQLYFKIDDESLPDFLAAGCQPFTYEARGSRVSLRYYEAPAEVFDEPEVMGDWARRAFAVALRARPAGTAAKAAGKKSGNKTGKAVGKTAARTEPKASPKTGTKNTSATTAETGAKPAARKPAGAAAKTTPDSAPKKSPKKSSKTTANAEVKKPRARGRARPPV